MKRNQRSRWLANSLSIVLALSFLIIGVFPVMGKTPSDQWVLVSQFGGSTQAIAVSGNIAYAGIGLRMNVIDVSKPAQPKLMGASNPFSDTIQDIAVQGKIAYVAAGAAGLAIIDVSDPSQPKTLSTWKSSGYAEGVAVNGKTVLLADGAKSIRVIDVSNPADPKEIGSAYSFNYAFDVVLSGSNAYVAAGDAGLLVLDIKEASKPKELAQLDTYGYAYEIAVSGKNVYIADAWEGVEVVDVSNPAKPVQTGTIATSGWSLGVAVSGKELISANGAQGSDIFDLANPNQPVRQGTYVKESSEGDAAARRAVITGNTAYIADTTNGLRVIDISKPENPLQRGLWGQLSYARRLTISGDYAYVATASEGAMYAINITDPLHPYQVSKFQADGIASDVVVNGDYATLGTFEDSTNCYTLIDISDPANPRETSTVDLQSLVCGAPRQMAAKGNYVYSADEWGLSIYDLTNPKAIKTIGRVELQQEGDQTVALSVAGDYAYVADAGTGLKIVDVSDPANPKFIRTYKVGTTVGSVFSAGDTLYLGHYGEGITSAANPTPGAAPSKRGSFKTRSSVEEATSSDGLLVASEGSGGLEILDTTNPANIQLIQAIETPGFAWASVIAGDYIYTADGAAGILVFEKQTAGQQAPQSSGRNTATVYPVSVTNSITKGPGAEAPNFPADIKKVTSTKTCTVNTADESGSGSLRECLSNATAGVTILFDPKVFSPQKPTSISLESQLPDLDDGSVTVDASNAGVILDGQQKVPTGLNVSSSYNTIMGIQFVNFMMDGITLGFPGQYNMIGGDHTVGAGPSGQGNVFTGDTNGIRALYTRHNTIKGNFVGTNAKGTQAGKANSIGIILSNFATFNQIGGPSVGEKNIISNNDRGLDIAANSAAYNVVAGNYVGTDVTGTKAIPNTSWGILIEVGGRNNTIGGTTEAERNIISGNNMGVSISDYAATQNSIIGNYIGLDVSGEKALPNRDGTTIFQSMYNRIGGTRPGEANLISANTSNGIRFFGMGSIHAILMGNIIGLDASGQHALANNTGLLIDGGTHNMIGGTSEGAGNTFINNKQGIRIEYAGTNNNWLAGNLISSSPQGAVMINAFAANNFFVKNTISKSNPGILIIQAKENTLHANSISDNSSLGIELRDGGNLAVAAPVISLASTTSVSGTACPNCVIEVFSDPGSQGLIYEGTVTADATGNFTFSGKLAGPKVTTTATDQEGNTSPFSKGKLF